MHHIFSTTFSNYTVSLLEDRVLFSLNAQQKRILLVVSAALSCLVMAYAIYRQCRFKAEVVPEDKKETEVVPEDKKEGVVDDAILLQDPSDLATQLSDYKKSRAIPLNDKLAMAKRAGTFLTSLDLEDTTVTDQQLKEVIEACPNLKDLKLHQCHQITDAVIQYLPRDLESLDLSYCKQITENAAKDLPPNLKGLTIETSSALGLVDMDQPLLSVLNPDYFIITLKDPADLAAQLHDQEQSKNFLLSKKLAMAKGAGKFLTSLNLEDTALIDMELERLMCVCPNLKSLNLRKCHLLTDGAMKYLPRDFETLYLNHCYQLTDEAIKNLPRDLKSLDLTCCREITDAAINYLPENLEFLNLSYCEQLTDAAIRDLPKNLKSLFLSHCHGITDAAIKDLSRDLERVDLSYCKQITEDAAKDLPPNLKGLIIEPHSQLRIGIMKHPLKARLTNADLLRPINLQDPADLAAQLYDHDTDRSRMFPLDLDKKLAMAKRAGVLLTSFDLAFTAVTDQQLKEVMEACPNLKRLILTQCNELTDEAIKNLPKDLQDLNIEHCVKFTDEMINYLPVNLVSLYLSGTKITSKAMACLPKNLKFLDLSYCKQFTDNVLENLPEHLKHLEMLKICECGFSDKAIKKLPINIELVR